MWNEEIDKGAFVITLNNEKAGSVATVGYTPSKVDYCAGRNWITIDYSYADDANYGMMTDIRRGHSIDCSSARDGPHLRTYARTPAPRPYVLSPPLTQSLNIFGDQYIDIKCSRIQGYDQALAKAILDGHTVDELYNNAEIARKYGFMRAAFTIYDNPMNGQVLTRSKNYDIDPIMHYTSTAAADDKHQSHPGDPKGG
jgi:hypothetical protein